MVVTIVLRLLAAPLESGELVGQVELVASGLIENVRGADEVVAFAQRASMTALPGRSAPATEDANATGAAIT